MGHEPLLPFLPGWPLVLSQVGWLAVLLLAAAVAGEFAGLLRLPRMVGYLLAGLLLGPVGGWIDFSSLGATGTLTEVALGFILFELGHRLSLSWLLRNKWLIVASLAEAALTAALVVGVLLALGVARSTALAVGLVAMGTSPVVTTQLVRELRAQGQVTERLLMLSALNSCYVVVAVFMWLAWRNVLADLASPLTMVLHPLYLVVGSTALAGAVAVGARVLPRRLRSREESELVLVVGLVLLVIFAAFVLRLSVLLTPLAFGLLAKTAAGWPHVLPKQFPLLVAVLSVLLFALLGASLEPSAFARAAHLGLAVVGARFVTKIGVAGMTARSAGISRRKGILLGLGLTPLSGFAVVLSQESTAFSTAPAAEVLVIVLAALMVLDFAGPVLARAALVRAGEVRPE